MKFYQYIAAGLLGVTALGSCTDLEEKPYTFVDPSSYYQNEDQLNSALNTVYNSFRTIYNDGGTFMRLEGSTDYGQPNREGNKNNINDMPNVERQNSAMEYAMWYQEHLLRMEDVLGRKMEAKIEELLDRKFHEYMEKTEEGE